MNAALMYCTNKYKRTIEMSHVTRSMNESFKALDAAIQELDAPTQINLYSITMQLIETIRNEPNNVINPLDVFIIQCESVLNGNKSALKTIGLAVGVVAIAIATLALGVGLGLGVGMLAGVWSTPLVFLSSLMAAQTTAVVAASAGVITGVGAGIVSGCQFFKTPKINTALTACIEQVKESQLSKDEELNREDYELYERPCNKAH